MDAIEAILTRHSTRDNLTAAIVQDDLQTILACGHAAPSSKNAKPWRFHSVQDATVLQRIADAMVTDDRVDRYVPTDAATGLPLPEYESSVAASAAVLTEAACGVFIENASPFCGNRRTLAEGRAAHLSEALVGYGFEMIGIGAAIQNLWLAAHALHYKAVFIGDVLIAETEVRRTLALDGDLVGVIALGRPRAAN